MGLAAESVVVKGRVVTRQAVEAAMAECDQLGMDAFLAKYGYARAQRYWLRGPVTHRRYPSKALLGAAAGLKAADFFGGASHTVVALKRLGFEVRDGDEPVGAVGLEALRAEAVAAGFDDPAPDWDRLPVTPAAVFASGSNRPGEVRGMARVGLDVGVCADYVTAATEAALVELKDTDTLVFCDSGAFSEVSFSPEVGGFVPTAPISHEAWLEKLALYRRLGAALGPQAWLVAPDQVGSQEVTLERLTKYRPQLQQLALTGARVMVVAQRGALSQADFFKAAVEAAGLIGYSGLVAGLPCKKSASSPAEVAAFLRDVKVGNVHLLGLGPNNPKVCDYLAPFAVEGCETSVSLDSCLIAASVGKTNGKGGGPRRYTKAQDFAGRVLAAAGRVASVASKAARDVALKVELALLMCFGAPLPLVAAPAGQLDLFAA